MTGRRPQRVAYHFAPSHRGKTTKWAAVLPLILNLTAASSLALCTASWHTPTALLSVRRPVPPPLLLLPAVTEYILLQVSGFNSRTLRLFCKLTSPAIVLFKLSTIIRASRVEASLFA
jgi:hypothetical protein